MRRISVLAMLLLTGCGPTPLETGIMVLLGTVIYLVTSGLLVGLVERVWRGIQRLPIVTAGASVGLSGTLLVLHALVSAAALALLVVTGEMMDSPGLTIIIVALSHLSFSLVLWRIFQRRPVVTAALASLLCLPLAVPLLFDSDAALELGIVLWLGSSYWGAVPGGLAVLLIIEAVIRRRLGARPDPTADVFD
jgi:hypothetical protein